MNFILDSWLESYWSCRIFLIYSENNAVFQLTLILWSLLLFNYIKSAAKPQFQTTRVPGICLGDLKVWCQQHRHVRSWVPMIWSWANVTADRFEAILASNLKRTKISWTRYKVWFDVEKILSISKSTLTKRFVEVNLKSPGKQRSELSSATKFAASWHHATSPIQPNRGSS